jgi:arsenical pump membrane protein
MVVVLLTASTLNKDLGLPTCLAAMVITAMISITDTVQDKLKAL